ncbi:hypothetical protein ABZV93_24990 [Actinopolymorpha sp. NPDC004070]|uniref:hypothetical protein n=1 Tax=Actinopolymorpha sp. NPDC004070 TaxID=3154548 RepID=UPI0033A605EE
MQASVGGPPPELLDPDAHVWHDPVRYRTYMSRRGWVLPVRERMGDASPPSHRRHRTAACGWAREAGVTTAAGFPDHRRLAELLG